MPLRLLKETEKLHRVRGGEQKVHIFVRGSSFHADASMTFVLRDPNARVSAR